MLIGLYCIQLCYPGFRQEISVGLQSSESSAATLPQDWQENFMAASFSLHTWVAPTSFCSTIRAGKFFNSRIAEMTGIICYSPATFTGMSHNKASFSRQRLIGTFPDYGDEYSLHFYPSCSSQKTDKMII